MSREVRLADTDRHIHSHSANVAPDGLPGRGIIVAGWLVAASALARAVPRVRKRVCQNFPTSSIGIADLRTRSTPESAEPYLRRLDLDDPDGVEETVMQKAVVAGLVSSGLIESG